MNPLRRLQRLGDDFSDFLGYCGDFFIPRDPYEVEDEDGTIHYSGPADWFDWVCDGIRAVFVYAPFFVVRNSFYVASGGVAFANRPLESARSFVELKEGCLEEWSEALSARARHFGRLAIVDAKKPEDERSRWDYEMVSTTFDFFALGVDLVNHPIDYTSLIWDLCTFVPMH